MGFWEWLATRREREVLKHYEEHINEVMKVMEHTYNLIAAFAENDRASMEKSWQSIFDTERRADEIKRKIIKELTEEFVHPIDREELIRLILATDDIATFAKEAGRMALLYKEPPPQQIVKTFLDMSAKIREAVNHIREAVNLLAMDKRKTLEVCDKVERLEEDVDDLRHRGLAAILSLCEELKVSNCILLKDILEYLEFSADRTEDVADELRSIAIFSS